MRYSVSPSFGKSAGNLMFVALLASTAAGCSSDVTRFGGLFAGSGQDQMTTGSVPRRSMSGLQSDPVPTADLQPGMTQPSYNSSNVAMNQPYPASTGTVQSNARMASAPVSVQRSDLAPPTGASPSTPSREKQVAMAQPFPAAPSVTEAPRRTQPAPKLAAPDPITTGTTPKASGWSASNAPSVMVRPGENLASLARRYGVPEKEILRANNMKSAAAIKPGETILIPTFNGGSNAAKASAQAADFSKGGKLPQPSKMPEQNVAVLPGTGSARDKSQTGADPATGKVAAGAGKGPNAGGGTYTVKPGDSLAKIAKVTGARVDDIKAANNLSASSIRIGQTLTIPNGSASADQTKTASIPVKAQPKPASPAASAAAETASAQPASYTPAATQTVDEVEKKADVASAAPESTGIGKYRWPVRGAVIAAYGANVNGSRNDGIDISVPQGTPIKAAENGVVIYAGNGLKQLGNTVLVRHDDGTVTVYGNADTLSVTRGQKVQRGQTVAVSGMSGSVKQPQVHFEVRKDASPVNPITFLE
ncbi:peptidoglycan DD-metalloendopeptidase family protein [Rhizobium sp. P32RR-XVIII]|uniref:peptidoglycan DD-metalloendopeptidase family protein n=1 Tax=Rhizobium sp. P32RR-XVIII TaxID=2726738 RepID=UPI0014573217|nr:peptidoglycan DD-metalloendopeptidase family protein [Rhizobium sp. P32RR-XVIII]NLS03506.1 peptidoglycan DD-metalloendopeptidase family protein [Rhizobium sp. P32RR-XVIII]